MIQFVCQLPRQLEAAEKAVLGFLAGPHREIVHDPQHELSLLCRELVPQQRPVGFRLLQHRYFRPEVKAVVQLWQQFCL
jgi:hypothetical protein